MLALLGLAAVPLASASGGNLTMGMLKAAADSASCRADFNAGYIGALETGIPSASSLQSYADKVKSDEQELQGLAAAGNATAFRDFMKSAFDPDMKSANDAVRSWRSDYRNQSNSSKESLKASYGQLRASEESCEFQALKEYANDRVESYDDALSDYSSSVSKLDAKGVPTSDLSSLISDARSQVVGPLQSAVSGATNVSQLRQALGGYCLYNGCKDGTNFHMAARFDSDRLGDILVRIQPLAQADGLGSNVTAAQTALSSVQSELASIGTSEYAQGQADTVWSGIRSVAGDLKGIIAGIRSSLP